MTHDAFTAMSSVDNRRQSRFWCFTVNNYDRTEGIDSELIDYLVVGDEIGDEGTPHLQGFVVFKRRHALPYVKKILPRAHWEILKTTCLQASDYCKKEGKILCELGTLPESKYVVSGEKTRKRWRETVELCREGRIDDTDEELQVRYYGNLKRIRQDHPDKVPHLTKPCGEWYYGPPDTGKSYAAWERYPDLFDKSTNKWWDGYRGEETILIDDFDRTRSELGHHLKRWADRYSFPAEQKGTTTRIRPKRIIITSNYLPSDIWSDDPVLVEAINKRFKVERFTKVYKAEEHLNK